MLQSARCKTEVGLRWFHMLPHSRVIILPLSLAQLLGLVREMGFYFSDLSRFLSNFYFLKGPISGSKIDGFFKSGFV